MSAGPRSPPREILSAALFTLGCAGLGAMVVWLKSDGLAAGLAIFALGWWSAMTIEGGSRAVRVTTRRRERHASKQDANETESGTVPYIDPEKKHSVSGNEL